MNARKNSDRYNTLAELHNYILQHQHDRKGTFEAEYREKSDQFNSPADLHNYILQHQYDRKGTFWLLFG